MTTHEWMTEKFGENHDQWPPRGQLGYWLPTRSMYGQPQTEAQREEFDRICIAHNEQIYAQH